MDKNMNDSIRTIDRWMDESGSCEKDDEFAELIIE
jgi:hypothetical protein